MQKTDIVDGKQVYYDDKSKKWRYCDTHKYSKIPGNKYCIITTCGKRVRNSTQYCSEHINWLIHSHPSSILKNDDLIIINKYYLEYSDKEIARILKNRSVHKLNNDSLESLFAAVKHYRRKYLVYRYSKVLKYKTIKNNYVESHTKCEICVWDLASCDIHHIIKENVFSILEKYKYHLPENMICVCPNHHRILETFWIKNKIEYKNIIQKYKPDAYVNLI